MIHLCRRPMALIKPDSRMFSPRDPFTIHGCFNRLLFLLPALLLVPVFGLGQTKTDLRGRVTDEKGKPIAFAIISIPSDELWATANDKGEFTVKNAPTGKTVFSVEYLDYAKRIFIINVVDNNAPLEFVLRPDNLSLNEVVVTAKRGTDLATSYVTGRTALDHMQMLGVTDAASLLPGGKTNRIRHLATAASQPFAVNGNATGERGNPLFGVGLEVDGIRLSNNALPGMEGSDTRNIATSNIESIEIITGLPSVEYGDLSNGLVKINTRKGKSPYIIEMMTKPNTKQVALSKGFELSPALGVLNMNIEYTKSISDLASPYTSYDRNGLSLNYSNTLNKKNKQPVLLNVGITGNIGGYTDKSDPDLFVNTYTRVKDNALRANVSAKWLLNRSWITNIEVAGTLNYNNKQEKTSLNKSASSSVAAIHTTEEGYHVGQTYAENPNAPIILIQPGYWYETQYTDNKIVNQSARFKANWARKYGLVKNNVMLGGEWSGSGNNGRGNYYADMRYAPTWREYRYDAISRINNYAVYIEDRVYIPVRSSSLQITGGLRNDITAINGSAYGTVSSLSPRLNTQYVFWEKSSRRVQDFSIRFSWGKMTKLPSFSILFPQPGYRDILTFAPGTTSSGQTFYAYYTQPALPLYNSGLEWQYTIQQEIGTAFTIDGNRVSLTAQQDKTYDPFTSATSYTPFTYKFTDQTNLNNSAIPVADRIYTVDKNTGIVTVSDRTGTRPSERVSYREITRGISHRKPVNGSSVTRRRINWIIDFKPIAAIKTSFRIDGNYYFYKGIEQMVTTSLPDVTMANGNPYKYIGVYTGGAASANGNKTRSLNMNVTAITHLPALRLIISARVEGSLYNYSRNLSEYATGQQRGFVLDNRNDNIPSTSKSDIYGGDRYVGYYPEYYVSLDDLNTQVPFAEKLLWAKDNDPALYNELTRLIVKSNTNYYFNEDRISAYYSANLGVTKEIGRIASVTFNAINFFNNMALYRSSDNNSQVSLFGDPSPIPRFYYGLSLRLKL